jgi:ubiquinone/menaquinone biosynthesis C-methylase UbiE
MLREYIAAGDTVVDVGCGPGFFAIDMAKLIGPTGKVVAVDLQADMLARVRRKAHRHGVAERLTCHRCRADRIGLDVQAQFILACYMVHETPAPRRLLAELKTMLAPAGRLLVVEPKLHVSAAAFAELARDGEWAGLQILERPKGKGGRALLLTPA